MQKKVAISSPPISNMITTVSTIGIMIARDFRHAQIDVDDWGSSCKPRYEQIRVNPLRLLHALAEQSSRLNGFMIRF